MLTNVPATRAGLAAVLLLATTTGADAFRFANTWVGTAQSMTGTQTRVRFQLHLGRSGRPGPSFAWLQGVLRCRPRLGLCVGRRALVTGTLLQFDEYSTRYHLDAVATFRDGTTCRITGVLNHPRLAEDDSVVQVGHYVCPKESGFLSLDVRRSQL
jgi:hypothetical protein